MLSALNAVDDEFSKVPKIMQDLNYYNEKTNQFSLFAFSKVSADCKAVLCNNLMSALIKKGSPEKTVSLAQSAGYWNGTLIISSSFTNVEPDHKAELVNNLAYALISKGEYSKVPEIMRSALYYSGTTITPSGFKNISPKHKAALCTNLASALNETGNSAKVINVFKSSALKDLPYTYKKELVNRFETALKNTGKENLVSKLKKSAEL